MQQLPGQMSIFDLDMPCGKMFPEHSAAIKERILESSSKNSAKSQTKQPMYLDLRTGSGTLAGVSWETGIPSLGECLMRDFGESPSEEEGSGLSQILEENVPLKYYLSAKACEGVLRRAKKRGKILDEILQTALKQQIERWGKYGSPIPLKIKSCKCVYPQTTRSLTARADSSPCIDRGQEMVVQGFDIYNMASPGEVAKTLTSIRTDSDHVPCVVCYDARGNGDGKISPTITGDHNSRITDYTTLVCEQKVYAICNGQADQPGLHKFSGALNCMHDQQAVVIAIDRADTAGCNGKGVKENESYTLNTIVRRLTPLECCRLQGMPDLWCKDVPHSDAQEYKMWGNGMALPNALYIMEGF